VIADRVNFTLAVRDKTKLIECNNLNARIAYSLKCFCILHSLLNDELVETTYKYLINSIRLAKLRDLMFFVLYKLNRVK